MTNIVITPGDIELAGYISQGAQDLVLDASGMRAVPSPGLLAGHLQHLRRIHCELLRLLFLHAHRETIAF